MTISKPWVFATKQVPECDICSNQLFSVRHPHITSLSGLGATEGRASLLLGSSTLHNVWLSHNYRPQVHTYHDCIIGGQVHDCHASFLHQLAGWTGRLDVVLACGVNNVSTRDSACDIIFQLKSLVGSIKFQNPKNNIVISSLLYAPKYCDASLPSSKNMLHKVREVNRWIEQFNMKETGLVLDLGLRGVVGDPMEGSFIVHRYQDWREQVKEKKLHLQQRLKDDIARELGQVFSGMRELG